ncbi:MAG TPA: ATP-binding protein [Ohtaekwangia sp.]|nr:ATP-binding protein [Ohtaekwangia sp.]
MAKAKKSSTDEKLRERVKELRCLYELSRIAGETENDIPVIFQETLKILPAAMQYPERAQAAIALNGQTYPSPRFDQTKVRITSPLFRDKTKQGSIAVGYVDRAAGFLPEEKKLLHTVARELSLILKRHSMEEERQNLQQQLHRVEQLALVGELTAGIAHELNEPLGRILGFAQLIKKGGSLNEQQAQDIERIVKASLYTREIIKKLMLFSRQMPQQITLVDLNEVISDILYFIDIRYQSREIRLKQRLATGLPAIQADAVQMNQVLVNLITNAIHAMPSGGDLLITTGKKGKYVSLGVRDSGHGMTAAVKKKIFEPFFTTKATGQGTGLGLSVVQGIVTAHQGKIQVTTAPGKGSKFEILLPIRQRKASRAS